MSSPNPLGGSTGPVITGPAPTSLGLLQPSASSIFRANSLQSNDAQPAGGAFTRYQIRVQQGPNYPQAGDPLNRQHVAYVHVYAFRRGSWGHVVTAGLLEAPWEVQQINLLNAAPSLALPTSGPLAGPSVLTVGQIVTSCVLVEANFGRGEITDPADQLRYSVEVVQDCAPIIELVLLP